MTKRAFEAILILGVAALQACGGGPDEATLARFDGGAVTAEELESSVLALPAEARPADPDERAALYLDLVRELAAREILVARGRREGVIREPEPARRLDEVRRQILAGVYLSREVEVEQPTPDEVEAFFESRRDTFARPERREVYHIFLRPEPGETREQLEARMRALRRRSLEGEPFPLLAREYSQSQLRHGDGALGWVTPGQLPPRLDEIVFKLEEGVPSEVLVTRSGAHLFLASTVVEAQAPTLDEARPQARRLLLQERQNEAVNEYLASWEADATDFEPTAEELAALLAGGDANAVVLRIGSWTLTAGELVERLDEATAGAAPPDGEAAHRLLQSIARAERVMQRAESAGLPDEPEVRESLRTAEESVLLPEMQRRALVESLEEDPAELEAFFARESRRFAGPLRLRVERVAVPLAADSGRVMGELERAVPALESGELELAELAARVGGRVEDPVWKSLGELRVEGGSLRGRLASVPAGGFSTPASNGRELELFKVVERAEPAVPAFESVRDAVVDAYLQAHGERLYEELVDRLLAAASLKVFDDHLAVFAERAIGIAPRDGAASTAGSDGF